MKWHEGHPVIFMKLSGLPMRAAFAVICLVLLTACVGKLFSVVFGTAGIYKLNDPVFGWQYRWTQFFALVVEGIVLLLIRKHGVSRISCLICIWLGSCFLVYRAISHMKRPGQACPCLGSITAVIGITENTANTVLILFSTGMVMFGIVGCVLLNMQQSSTRTA